MTAEPVPHNLLDEFSRINQLAEEHGLSETFFTEAEASLKIVTTKLLF
jgi:hypothetical protein